MKEKYKKDETKIYLKFSDDFTDYSVNFEYSDNEIQEMVKQKQRELIEIIIKGENTFKPLFKINKRNESK